MKKTAFVMGLLVLIVTEITRVCFMALLPGGPSPNNYAIARNVSSYIWLPRFLGLALAITPLLADRKNKGIKKGLMVAGLLVYGALLYYGNLKLVPSGNFY